MQFSKLYGWRFFAIAIIILLSGLAIGEYTGQNPLDQNQPNVVLVSIESTPSYKLPCYGYQRNTTSELCNFAEKATLYEETYTPGSYTALSMSSVATGKYPYKIGVTDEYSKIKLEENTLAERLSDSGYRTYNMGFNAIPVYNQLQGFQSNLRIFSRRNHITRVLKQNNQPVFVRVHVWATHGYRNKGSMEVMNQSSKIERLKYIDELKNDPSYRENHNYTWNSYDERLRMADKTRFERVIEEIKASREYEDSLIIFTSDHGELLYKKDNRYGHEVPGTRDELVKVPLIVKYPGQENGKRVEETVSTVDIFPTVLDTASIKYSEELDGISLLSKKSREQAIISSLKNGITVIRGEYKLYHCSESDVVEGCDKEEYIHYQKQNGSWENIKGNGSSGEQVFIEMEGAIENYLAELEETELKKDRKVKLKDRLQKLGYVE